MKTDKKLISRRDALKVLGTGTFGLFAASSGVGALATACTPTAKEAKVALRKDIKSGNKVSLLGFGGMRFPLTGEKEIDEQLSQQLIDYAYAHGVNYFDTAWNYHKGTSEPFFGKALKKFPRESFYLASKMPGWTITDLNKAKETFQAQLDRTQVEYFDYYLLHAISKREDYDRVYREYGVLDYLKQEKKAGRIKRLGFSFHGDMPLFDYLLDQYDWDFVQIQLNYYDWEELDAKTLYKKLEDRKLPVIVMEPVRGGMLAKLTPDSEAVLKAIHPDKSTASWSFRYCASLPNVLTILSGMTAMEHVVDNVNTLSTDFKPLDEKERVALDEALRIFKKYSPIRCTTCKYCMPCKFGVDIPAIFSFYNQALNESKIPDIDNPNTPEFKKRKNIFLSRYAQIPDKSQAHRCISCGKCETMCPQKIEIPKELERIDKLVKAVSATN